MTVAQWDVLHSKARHRLEYPSEHVVRFLAGVERDPEDTRQPSALDIGCGSGRHTILLEQFGYQTLACDASEVACQATRKLWNVASRFVKRADMTNLPYPDDTFDVAVAYGVFYYGTRQTHMAAAAELHRVLKPGGSAFVVVRTQNDWRYFPNFGLSRDDPEWHMVLDFCHLEDLDEIYSYGTWSDVRVEKSEWTIHELNRTNSDWLITLRK